MKKRVRAVVDDQAADTRATRVGGRCAWCGQELKPREEWATESPDPITLTHTLHRYPALDNSDGAHANGIY